MIEIIAKTDDGKYQLEKDWNQNGRPDKFWICLSGLIIEHFNNEDQSEVLQKFKDFLKPEGYEQKTREEPRENGNFDVFNIADENGCLIFSMRR